MDPKGSYFLSVSALEAESLLKSQGREGSYLIRPSESSANDQSLSIRHKDDVIHIKIQNTGEAYDLYGGEEFATLMELVKHYTEEPLHLQGGDSVRLTKPLCSSAISYRSERWFHGEITPQQAEERLRDHENSFLVRESQSIKGDFVLSVKTGKADDNKVTHIIIRKDKGKYEIGDGKRFNDLYTLIDYYRSKKITAQSGDAKLEFTLQQSVTLGKFKAKDIFSRVAELSKMFQGRDKDRDGFWEEFQQIQQQEVHNGTYSMPRTAGQEEINRKKNRFKNILPINETRVKLKDGIGLDSDYINANYIMTKPLGIDGLTRNYIATQGCLKNTCSDMWQMVWQENSSIIVMTTGTVELGRNKCFQYWPEDEGGTHNLELGKDGSMEIKCVTIQNFDEFKLSVLELTKNQKTKNLGTRTVYHYQYPGWPDKMAPSDTKTILSFIKEINEKQESLNDSSPLIVHCSAGIGRTGTFIMIDIIMNLIKRQGLDCLLEIPNILAKLREMRAGMVQTEFQYKFIYLAIEEFIENRGRLTPFPPLTTNAMEMTVYENDNTVRKKPPPLSPKPTDMQIYANLE